MPSLIMPDQRVALAAWLTIAGRVSVVLTVKCSPGLDRGFCPMSYSSLPKFLVLAVSSLFLIGCGSDSQSSKGSFDKMPEAQQKQAAQDISDQMNQSNKKAMEQQGFENMPAGVGPQFPDKKTYNKGGKSGAPAAPTQPNAAGGGSEPKKN